MTGYSFYVMLQQDALRLAPRPSARPSAHTMKLSIIIPAFNEQETLEAVVRHIEAVDLGHVEKEIIVVNDASTDRTQDIMKRLAGIVPISHPVNLGKGGALATGIKAATGDIVLFQDADLEYTPDDYAAVIAPLLQGRCEAVMGSRFLHERPRFWGKRRSPYWNHYVGNQVILAVTNRLYGQQFTDYEGCYKAFLRRLLLETPIKAQGFEFDNELMCKLIRKGIRIEEVPIHYVPRTYAEGKKITWQHGMVILWTILKWRLLPIG